MNNEMKLVTIIVPIYNVEKYLEKCVESILSQTYKNIEIILVNDGSTDGSLDICKRYADLDKRIRIIDKRNGGLSDARNAGLDAAHGEFVGFVDSDDWIAEEMYQRLVTACEMYHADMSACKMKRVNAETIQDEEHDSSCICLSQKEAIQAQVTQDKNIDMNVSVCCKLFRRDLIGDGRFQKGVHYEDILFSINILQEVNKCAYDPTALYYYRQNRDDSITNSWLTERVFTDWIPNWEKRRACIEKMGYNEIAQTDEFYFFCHLIDIYFAVYESKKKELYQDAERTIVKLRHNPTVITYAKTRDIGKTHDHSATYKLKLFVAYFSPRCMYVFFTIIHRLRKLISRVNANSNR